MLASTLILFAGCNGALPTPAGNEFDIDEKLPVITLTKRGVVADMNEIAFEWKPIGQSGADGIKIYRSIGESNASYLIHTINNRYSTHFVDLDVRPDTLYTYAFRSYKGDRVSNKSKEHRVYSKPPLPSVAWIYAINGLPRMAKILWRPHKSENVEYYIIERKTIEGDEWEKVARVRGRLQAEYIDTDLKDKSTYRYRIRVQTFDGILSTPSEIVKVVTKPLPPVVTGLTATTKLPKEIRLHWNKSSYKDFERYYLYRSEDKDGDYELIAKLYNNYFTDRIDQDGAVYYYKIAQKDIDGLESKKDASVVMGATLPKPLAPTLQDAKFTGSAITLRWIKTDPRSVKYLVEREERTGWFESKTKKFTTSQTHFVDKALLPNTKYTYRIYAVDKYGIVSNPSNEVSISVEELKTNIQKTKKALKETVQKVKKETAVIVDDLSLENE